MTLSFHSPITPDLVHGAVELALRLGLDGVHLSSAQLLQAVPLLLQQV